MTIRFDTARKLDDPTVWPRGLEKWTVPVIGRIALYIGVCFILILSVPNTIFDTQTRSITWTIGALGAWRYGWWFTHAIRALIYGRIVYPRMRRRGAKIWNSGWRPRHLHFMMTTYKEHREITEMVVRSIVREVKASGVRAASLAAGLAGESPADAILSLAS